MFQKMAGGDNDSDDIILQAFMAYDQGGKIDVIFEQFDIDEDYMVKTKEVVGLLLLLSKRRRRKRRRKRLLLRLLPMMRVMMPRRRRRRRRRPPSKLTSQL